MGPRLEWSEHLGRLSRTEPVSEQGILTWDLVRDAILHDDPEAALEWLRYIKEGENYVKPDQNRVVFTIQQGLTFIAEHYGEEHVERLLRWWRRKLIVAAKEPTYSLTPLERLQYHAEMERADYSGPDGKSFSVWEEEGRYVMELNPCGSCGRMRRDELSGTGPALGKTSRAHPWSWQKASVPYYCTHNCIWWEIMSIEDIGYPAKIYDWSEDPEKACRVFFYKDPLKIPEEYFTRVGLKKDPSKYKRYAQKR